MKFLFFLALGMELVRFVSGVISLLYFPHPRQRTMTTFADAWDTVESFLFVVIFSWVYVTVIRN